MMGSKLSNRWFNIDALYDEDDDFILVGAIHSTDNFSGIRQLGHLKNFR